jgi:hypothetical protein
MKKCLISEILIFAYIAILLIGCAPSAQPTVIPLAIDDQKISLEFLQNDINIPVSNHNNQLEVVLKPQPFTLMINGDKKIVSILALQSEDLASPLIQSSKPWVAPLYTGNAFSANDLFLSFRSIDFYSANSYTLRNLSFNSFSAVQATDMANTLKNQFGTEPLALLSARTYLTDKDQNYLIKTLKGNTIQSGESIVLLVFIEKQSNDPFFKVLKWLTFNLTFQ